jgi:hypothetical protein
VAHAIGAANKSVADMAHSTKSEIEFSRNQIQVVIYVEFPFVRRGRVQGTAIFVNRNFVSISRNKIYVVAEEVKFSAVEYVHVANLGGYEFRETLRAPEALKIQHRTV